MKKLLTVLTIAALVVLASACCRCRSIQKKSRRPLVGTTWQLRQLNGRAVPTEADQYTLTFMADGTVAGLADCNRMMGQYTTDESRKLAIRNLASTMMLCPDGDHEQEYAKALESVTHYDMDGPMLMLLSNGELCTVFEAVDLEPLQKE